MTTLTPFQYLITPTAQSPILPEAQSKYTTTPDVNLLMTDKGLFTTGALNLKYLKSDETLRELLPPACFDTLNKFEPLFTEMAKHERGADAFNTGGLTGWLRSTTMSWALWWNKKDMFKSIMQYTRQHWDVLYAIATEDERANVFASKPPHVLKRMESQSIIHDLGFVPSTDAPATDASSPSVHLELAPAALLEIESQL